MGGVNIGERGLRELIGRYGIDCVNLHVDAFLSASEKAMRAKIREIPEGKYTGEKSLDDDVASDRLLTVRVEIIVGAGEINFDFSRSDAQSPRYMNSTDAFTRSMAMLTVFGILEHDQSNDGSLRPFSFINPPGTCVHAEFPHSTVLATCSMAEAVQEAVQLALAPVVPEKIAAPSTKLIFPIVSYIHPVKKRLDVNVDFFFRCNPSGGTLGYDGWEQGGPAQEMGMGAALILRFMSLLILSASSASSRRSIRRERGVIAVATGTSIAWNISWLAKTRPYLDQAAERMRFPRDFSVGKIRSLAD